MIGKREMILYNDILIYKHEISIYHKTIFNRWFTMDGKIDNAHTSIFFVT